jgi:hypothetical protein
MGMQGIGDGGAARIFDGAERLKALSAAGDPLERLAQVIDFEVFRKDLERALSRSDRAKGGRAGEPPWPTTPADREMNPSEAAESRDPGVSRSLVRSGFVQSAGWTLDELARSGNVDISRAA